MRNRISDSLKTAMREKQTRRTSTLRLINAAIGDRDIALRGKGKDKADDEEILDILTKMVKQREESSRMYREAGREELEAQELEEMEIIREFLPKQLSPEEAEAAVAEAMLVATNRQEKLIHQSETLLKEMQTALVEAAGSTVAQQEQLIKQGDIMLQVVEATGQVKQLEDALNSNLQALAGSQNFEQTVAGLSAALQILSIHLVGKPLETASEIELAHQQQSGTQPSKAA